MDHWTRWQDTPGFAIRQPRNEADFIGVGREGGGVRFYCWLLEYSAPVSSLGFLFDPDCFVTKQRWSEARCLIINDPEKLFLVAASFRLARDSPRQKDSVTRDVPPHTPHVPML
jgi:hypothetical protein